MCLKVDLIVILRFYYGFSVAFFTILDILSLQAYGKLSATVLAFCKDISEISQERVFRTEFFPLTSTWESLIIILLRSPHFLNSSIMAGLPAETSIERFVTIGAYSLLRSCTIEPECIIGQHSILMEGSLVESHSILEAGSVLPPGRRIPTGELWAGNPARFVRTLTHEETVEIPKLAVAINDLSKSHFSEFLPYSTVYLEVEKLKKSFGIHI